MGMRGERFLELSQADTFHITSHALKRILDHTDRALSKEDAFGLFLDASHLKFLQMSLLGYRPGYERRKLAGEKSWYFRFTVDGKELVAVLGEGKQPGEYVWLTTYGRNRESDCRQLVHFEELAAA